MTLAPSTWRLARGLAAVGLFAALLMGAPAPQAEPLVARDQPVSIEVKARTIDYFNASTPELRRFGHLDFRGGLELTSPVKEFGGLSALKMDADGQRFVSLTDKGSWFTGRIVYRGAQPVAIADAVMAPMLAAGGRPLAAQGWYDTESLAADNGTFYVGIERVNRIVKFDFGRDGVRALAQPIATPPELRSLPNNRGLEGLVFVPKGSRLSGTLIAFSERGLDRAGNLRAFLIGGPTPGNFTVLRKNDFDISDAALLPSGDVLLLERRFSWASGVAIRIRRIPLSSIAPGAVVDGPELLFADLGYQIDNMEGLGIHRSPQGETVLTLISDDNFSALQRTILLQFTLIDE